MPTDRLGTRELRGLLIFAAALEAWSWSMLEGYQLADSVEYMENAQALVRGVAVVDSPGLRSFGFAGLLTPIFWVADRLGLEDLRPLVAVVRLLQVALGLALVHVAARLGERAGGRLVALASGFTVAVNPVFLQYAVSPVSGIAAGVCIGHAWLALDRDADRRHGLRAGAWMGVAVLMAYQSLIVVGPMLLLALARDGRRWRGRRAELLGLAGGFLLVMGLQVALDRLVYGRWGQTLTRYFMENFGSIGAVALHEIGLTELARRLYDANPIVQGGAQREIADTSMLLPPHWYLTNLPKMLVWPLLAAGVLGVARCLRAPRFLPVAMLLVLLLNVALMSVKGSKDFRLWLPLLPMLAVTCGQGWAWLWGAAGAPAAGGRRALALLMLLAATVLGVQQLGSRNPRRFAGWWRAMDFVAERVRERRAADPSLPRAKVASAYHWAVFLRETPDIELVKLPHHLDWWDRYGDEERGRTVVALLEMDWFLVHLPVLEQFHELTRYVALSFEVADVLWDRRCFEDMGPLLVLERVRAADDGARGRRLYRVREDADPELFRAERGLPPPVRFARDLEAVDSTGRTAAHRDAIDFLGAEYDVLPSGHGWLTYHFATRGELLGDYVVVDRLTTPGTAAFWQNDHWPAWGVHPTCSSRPRGWQPGWIVSESWPVVASERPYAWQEPFRPLGGEWRRADLAPTDLWMQWRAATWRSDEPGSPARFPGRLEPVASSPAEVGAAPALGDAAGEAAGLPWRFSPDGLLHVARLLTAIHPLARAADDGRPISPTPVPRAAARRAGPTRSDRTESGHADRVRTRDRLEEPTTGG